jgi:hypothetical protein
VNKYIHTILILERIAVSKSYKYIYLFAKELSTDVNNVIAIQTSSQEDKVGFPRLIRRTARRG